MAKQPRTAAVLDFTCTDAPNPPATSHPPGATMRVPDSTGVWHWTNAAGQDLGLISSIGSPGNSQFDMTKARPLSQPGLHPMPHGATMRVWSPSDGQWHWSDGQADLGAVDDPGSWNWG